MTMKRRLIFAGLLLVALLVAVWTLAPAHAQKGLKPVQITWDDLWPEGEDARLEKLYEDLLRKMAKGVEEGSADDKMIQIGTFTTVKAYDNKPVRIPGYVVPFDFQAKGELKEFLLVPYFGACLHTPPPPPNLIVYVSATPAVKIKDIWGPVWVEGVFLSKRHDSNLADAAYSLTLTKIEPYERQ